MRFAGNDQCQYCRLWGPVVYGVDYWARLCESCLGMCVAALAIHADQRVAPARATTYDLRWLGELVRILPGSVYGFCNFCSTDRATWFVRGPRDRAICETCIEKAVSAFVSAL